MQSRESLLPNGPQKIKQCVKLIPLITGFTVGDELNNEYGYAREQKYVDKPAFVKDKLQNKPND